LHANLSYFYYHKIALLAPKYHLWKILPAIQAEELRLNFQCL